MLLSPRWQPNTQGNFTWFLLCHVILFSLCARAELAASQSPLGWTEIRVLQLWLLLQRCPFGRTGSDGISAMQQTQRSGLSPAHPPGHWALSLVAPPQPQRTLLSLALPLSMGTCSCTESPAPCCRAHLDPHRGACVLSPPRAC